MRNRLLYLIIFAALTYNLYAQKQADNWYFGRNAGLTFTNGSPKALTDGAMNTLEGCAVISDRNGNLMFYTDGMNVWNRNHKLMENGSGLLGDASATQSAVIVPDPGSVNHYYVFTVTSMAGDSGVRYSVVDMSKDGGLGSVTQKNIFLYAPSTEKLTAVKHGNGNGVWIITHEWDSDKFRSYLVTESGVAPEPVISQAGSQHTGSKENVMGYLKASHDGKRIALMIFGTATIEIFDFDNNTGLISNPRTIAKDDGIIGGYGIEFSPDGTKLYASSWSAVNSYILQYDLGSMNSDDIKRSAKVIGTFPKPEHYYALQSAPDGRIYAAINKGLYLSSINDPDKPGKESNFTEVGVDLSGRESALGLPDFVQSFFHKVNIICNNPICEGETLYLSASYLRGAQYKWSGPNGFSSSEATTSIPNMAKQMSGKYTLDVSDSSGEIMSSSVVIDVKQVRLDLTPRGEINLGHSCIRDSISRQVYIKNESSDDAYISSIKITSGINIFKIGQQFNFPQKVKAGDSLALEIKFLPLDSVDYHDSIRIETVNPCTSEYSVLIKGTGLSTATLVWLPDTTAAIGDFDFCLPFKSRLSCSGDGKLTGMAFTAEIAFNASFFLPQEGQDFIKSSRVENGIRILEIEGGGFELTSKETLLANICGSVLLGDELSIPIEIRKFAWSDSLIGAHKENGSITTGNICGSNLRRVKAFEPLKLAITPNPAGDNTEITVSGQAEGRFDINIYNINGEKVRAFTDNKGKDSDLKIRLNAYEIPAGIYQVVARYEGGAMAETMVVVR